MLTLGPYIIPRTVCQSYGSTNYAHKGLHSSGGFPASRLQQRASATAYIVSYCAQLDGLMGGGIPTGQVTELCALKHLPMCVDAWLRSRSSRPLDDVAPIPLMCDWRCERMHRSQSRIGPLAASIVTAPLVLIRWASWRGQDTAGVRRLLCLLIPRISSA